MYYQLSLPHNWAGLLKEIGLLESEPLEGLKDIHTVCCHLCLVSL